MSPFRPSFFPSPVCFRAPRSYSLLTTHYSLPTFPRPLFSYSYKSLFPQLFYIHIHTNPRGCWGILCALSRHSFTPILEGALATRHFPFTFINLPPLALSLSSFPHSGPLFSIACSLFLQNTRGGGIPNASTGHPGWGVLRSGISATSGRRAQGFPPLCLSGKSRPCFAEGALKLSTYNCRLLTAPPCQPGGPVRGAGPRRSAGRRSGQARRCLPSSSMDALHPPMPVLLLSSDAHRATRRGFGWPPGSSHAYSELLPRQRLSLSGVTPTARSGRASPQRTGGKPR